MLFYFLILLFIICSIKCPSIMQNHVIAHKFTSDHSVHLEMYSLLKDLKLYHKDNFSQSCWTFLRKDLKVYCLM